MKKIINVFTLGVFLISNIMTPLTNFIYAEENETLEESGDLSVVRDMEDVENSNENIPESSPEETVDNPTGEESLPAVEPEIQPEEQTDDSPEDLPESTESHNSAVTPVEDEEENKDASTIQEEKSVDEEKEIMGDCPSGQQYNEELNICYTKIMKNNVPVYYGTDMDTSHKYNNNPIGTITVFVSVGTEQVPITMMDKNLGATSNDISSQNSYGELYQRGNNAPIKNVTTTQDKADYENYWPGHSYNNPQFVIRSDDYWKDIDNTTFNNLWGGLSDTGTTTNINTFWGGIKNGKNRQGPCPNGYHVPSQGEWNALGTYWKNSKNSISTPISTVLFDDFHDTSFMSDFKLPYVGYRDNWVGEYMYDDLDRMSQYRTSSPLSSNGKRSNVLSLDYYVNLKGTPRTYGNPIRCFKDSPDIVVHEVTFHDDSGKLLGANSQGILKQLVEHGHEMQIPIEPKKGGGSEFLGWTKTLNGTDYFDLSTPVEGDMDLYAKWENFEFKDLELYFLQKDGTLKHYTIMDRNMGATEVYNQDYDHPNTNSYGYHYQWGNNYGFAPCIGNGCKAFPGGETTTTTISKNIWSSYAPSTYTRNTWSTSSNWMENPSRNDNIWGGAGDNYDENGDGSEIGANNDWNVVKNRQGPCPELYYIPSIHDWSTIKNTWSNSTTTDTDGIKFTSDLLLPFAGYRSYDKTVYGQGFYENYWSSSTSSSDFADYLYIYYSNVSTQNGTSRTNGATVRCAKSSTNNSTFTLHTNGGSKTVVAFIGDVGEGKMTALGIPSKENYKFEGWYSDKEYKHEINVGDTVPLDLYAKRGCPEGYIMEGEKCVYSGKMATLMTGELFNSTLTNLAIGPTNNLGTEKIKGFVWRDSLPEGINSEDIEKISIDGSSDVPVYAWFDQTGYSNGEGIIYYTSEADKIYMNQNSSVMFYNMQGLTSLDLSNLDTSKVTNMSSMFQLCSNLKTLILDGWDLSQSTNGPSIISSMFVGASSLEKVSMRGWKLPVKFTHVLGCRTSQLCATTLQELDVSDWDLSQTIDIGGLFAQNSTRQIIGLNTWDTSNIRNMNQMFFQCSNLKSLDLSNFDTSNVEDIGQMFQECSNLKSLDLSNFDTSKVRAMYNIFQNCSSLKSLNLDNWDFSKMSYYAYAMFYGTSSLKTLSLKNWVLPENASSFVSDRGPGLSAQLDWIDVSGWDLSKTTNLYGLFGANQTKKIIGLETWDTSNVQNMKSLFQSCTNLTELDLSNFDISNVTNIEAIFAGCSNLTSLKLDNWNLLQSPSMGGMFQNATNLKELSLKNWTIPTSFHQILSADTSSTSTGSFLTAQLNWIDVSGWDLSQTTDISGLFKQSNTKAIIGMDTWDTSNITDMGNLFNSCANLTSLNLDNWNLVNIDVMGDIFNGTNGLKKLSLKHWVLPTNFTHMLGNRPTQLAAALDWIDVSDWDLSHTTSIQGLFADSNTHKIIGLNTWDTSNITDMSQLFRNCPNLTELDVSGLDLDKTTDVSSMFRETKLSKITGLDKLDTSSVKNMDSMFRDGINLESLDLGNWDTSNVENMRAMFAGDENLTELDLSSWNTESATNMSQMIVACSKLKTIYASDKFTTANVTNSDAMFFLDTVLVGGKGTTYTESHTNKEYARIDEGTSNPGYFTKANTITYNLNGGERESGNGGRTTYSPLSSFTLPTPVREGYTFIGWTGSNGKKPKKEVKIQQYTYGDLTYTANWEINNYKIIFDTDGGNEITPIEVEYNSVLSGIELPSPTKECNGFAGWDKELPETMPAEDITLKATWNYVCREYSGGGGGGGGGGSTSAIDVVKESVDKNTHNAADDKEGTSEDNVKESTDSSNIETSESTYSEEFTEAYKFAKSNGITTKSTIQEAKMNSTLTRIQMAKMLSYYAINVLGQDPDMTKTIKFEDVSDKRDVEYDNGVTLAYQLGIMGINMKNNKFRPDDEVTRAEFVTALSRMIYEMKDGTGKMKYYEPHMARLYNEGVINKADPKMKEKRGYVMIMLMRTIK